MSQYEHGGRRANPYGHQGGDASAQMPAPQQYGGAPSPWNGGPAIGFDNYGDQQNPNAASPRTAANTGRGQNVEMESLIQNGSQFGRGNPSALLKECREIDKGIDEIKSSLSSLAVFQQRYLNDADSSAQTQTSRQLDTISSETIAMYRNFAGRIRDIKQQTDSSTLKNTPQVARIDRKLKAAIQEYQRMDWAFREKLKEQTVRQYRIVRPDASEAEVREAVEGTSNQQVFSQALLQSDRRGQSRAALSAVENRRAAIQKIDLQMIELAALFQDMEALVLQQEAVVQNIERHGEEVVENMDTGVQQMGVAIQSARNARKWKWWCLGICVLIVVIIVIVVLVYKLVLHRNSTNKNKRDLSARSSFTTLFYASSSSLVPRITGLHIAQIGRD